MQSVLDLDTNTAFDNANRQPAISTVVDRATLWLAEFDGVDEWFSLTASESECRAIGLNPVVDRLASGVLAHERAMGAYRFARAEAMWGEIIGRAPELGSLQGDERTTLVERFRDLEHQVFVVTPLSR